MTFADQELAAPRPTDRTAVRRHPERQRVDRQALDDVLDSAQVAHVAISRDGGPVILPVFFARDSDHVLLHGSTGGGLLREAAGGAPVAVAVTVLDGLVFADSMFNSSANYRSAVVLGQCRVLEGEAKVAALRVLSDHLMPGRWDEVPPPTQRDLAATMVLALPLEEASVKVRTGPPSDATGDGALWRGVVPRETVAGTPIPADDESAMLPLPPSVQAMVGKQL